MLSSVEQTTHVFCTYFDHNYLPRALLMLRSLRSVDPDTPIFVLALSELCCTVLSELAPPGIEIVPLAALEAEFPELPALKGTRSAIEYIFTLTPFLPLHLFRRTAAASITYIDADLYFYDDPRAVLAATRGASIAVTPHRFSPDHLADARYGRFNVGWVTFRRDREGLACLEQYRADCTAWCYDRVEEGRYADQGYLDRWPEHYPSLAVIAHKGVNLALWNVDNYTLTERDGRLLVDDEPLVFYHFHGIRQRADGTFDIWLPQRHGAEDGVLRRRIYAPYMVRLIVEREALLRRFPALAGAEARLRYHAPDAGAGQSGMMHDCGTVWPLNLRDARHDDAVTRRLVAELVAQDLAAPPVDHPALRAALYKAAGSRGRIRVLDWGGGVGLARLLASRAVPGIALDWHVVDTPSRCAHGAVLQPGVTFHAALDDLPEGRFDLVLAGTTIGTARDWRGLLQLLGRRCGRVLLLDRFVTTTGRASFVSACHEAGWPSETRLQAWVPEETELSAALDAARFDVAQFWASAPFDWPIPGMQRRVSVLCTVRESVEAPPPSPVVTLRTPRLILREWRDGDFELFAAMSEDPEGMRHFPPIPDRAASDAMARYIRTSLAADGFGFWAVELPGQAEFIGYVGMAETRFDAPFTPAIVLGWRLARPYWGMGYATEAASVVLDHAFGTIGFQDVAAFTVPQNERSRRVMERLGMIHDPDGDFDDPRRPEGDPLRRQVLYRLSCEDWAARRSSD